VDADGGAGDSPGGGHLNARVAALAGLLVAGTAWAAPTAEDLYAQASAAFEAGDPATASAQLDDFRSRFADHRLFWPASMLWARCALEPGEAEKRFKTVMDAAPADTKAECEMELAHLLFMREKYPEAEAAYAEWLDAHPHDERAEGALYWKAVCLREEGKEPEAAAAALEEFKHGRQEGYRSLAGLLAAAMTHTHGDVPGAYAIYRELAGASWARSVRPQALLGAAESAATPSAQRRECEALVKAFPETDEADAARAMLKKPPRTKGRFGLQVGAYKSLASAKVELAKWKKQGKSGRIVKRPAPGFGSLQFVILGPYPTRTAAELERASMKAAGVDSQVTSL